MRPRRWFLSSSLLTLLVCAWLYLVQEGLTLSQLLTLSLSMQTALPVVSWPLEDSSFLPCGTAPQALPVLCRLSALTTSVTIPCITLDHQVTLVGNLPGNQSPFRDFL